MALPIVLLTEISFQDLSNKWPATNIRNCFQELVRSPAGQTVNIPKMKRKDEDKKSRRNYSRATSGVQTGLEDVDRKRRHYVESRGDN